MAQLGMVGLGRMGANIVRRLMRDGHECVVYDVNPDAISELAGEGAVGAETLSDLASKLDAPRAVWVMVPAGDITEQTVNDVAAVLDSGDAIIDGGNSYYRDDMRRSAAVADKGIDYIDCGTSGGVFGLDRGYCLMIGGPDVAVERLDPIFRTVAPGVESAERTPGRSGRPQSVRKRLPALRPERRGPLREDGPQRHRVRGHGGLRRGPQHPPERQRRQGRAHGRRRDRSPRAARVLPVRHRHPRGRGGLAPRQRDRVVAPRPHRRRAPGVARPRRLRGPRLRLGRGPLDLDRRDRRGRSGTRCSRTPSTPAFASRGLDDFADKVLSAMRKQFGGHDEKKD